MPYFEIVDILALYTKMINFIENIHDFEINRLMDSAIHLYLITLPELLPPTCYCSNVVKSRHGSANSSHEWTVTSNIRNIRLIYAWNRILTSALFFCIIIWSCRYGGIGRRSGLKILWPVMVVSVRPRLPALEDGSRDPSSSVIKWRCTQVAEGGALEMR